MNDNEKEIKTLERRVGYLKAQHESKQRQATTEETNYLKMLEERLSKLKSSNNA